MLTILCPAKVNLFLAVQGKDRSGYHLLDTVFMRTLALNDALSFERANALSFECDSLPAEGNSVLKAIEVFERHVGKKQTYKIRLEKGIPPGSGLGGASSDAAKTLEALNDLGGYSLPKEVLMDLGTQVGMDVPFFLSGYSVAHGTHYGEQLELLPLLPTQIQHRIQLGQKPASTKEMFERWDKEGTPSGKTSAALIKALKAQDAESILKNLHNDFQQFYEMPSEENAVLTGSGSAFVRFFT